MSALVHTNLIITQGADWLYAWTWLTDNVPRDLTGWTGKGQVRRTVRSSYVLCEWNSDGTKDGPVELTSGGDVIVRVPAVISSAWLWTYGVYDLELRDPSGVPTRFAEGVAIVEPEITR